MSNHEDWCTGSHGDGLCISSTVGLHPDTDVMRERNPKYPFADNMQFCSEHGRDSDVIDVLECSDCKGMVRRPSMTANEFYDTYDGDRDFEQKRCVVEFAEAYVQQKLV